MVGEPAYLYSMYPLVVRAINTQAMIVSSLSIISTGVYSSSDRFSPTWK